MIMLTSNGRKDQLLEAFRHGVDDFMAKPLDSGELTARLKAGMRIVSMQLRMTEQYREVSRLNEALFKLNEDLDRMASIDALTGLFNRRAAMARFEEQARHAKRYGRVISCAMLDIDHFKSINDRYGHPAGDFVLKQVAGTITRTARETDVIGRVGGEEFLIILPNEAAGEAMVVLQRLRQLVAELNLEWEGQPIRCSISGGVCDSSLAGYDTGKLMSSADAALYAAKTGGRNRIVSWTPPSGVEAPSCANAA
jgi:diguanylate cyclase (GGDEF)-like protein